MTYLLWFGDLPEAAAAAEHRRRLAATRGLPKEIRALLEGLPRDTHPLDRSATPCVDVRGVRSRQRASDPDANLRKAYRLMNLVPETVGRVAAHPDRARARRSAPRRHSRARFLHLLDGRAPSAEVAHVLDVALILHADHELNASTFAARVAVATLADLHAAVTAAVATLKGPRHGGANEDVLAMLLEIADPARAEAFVEARISARSGLSKTERADPKARMPGFGHRVYKVDDARARLLRGMAKSMADATGKTRLFEVAQACTTRCTRARPCRERDFSPRVLRARIRRTSHVDLRGGALGGVDGAHLRAVRGQPAHPPRGVHRAGAAAAQRVRTLTSIASSRSRTRGCVAPAGSRT